MADTEGAHRNAGLLAQLLSDVILTVHPQVAQFTQDQRTDALHGFLEGLEAHGAGVTDALLAALSSSTAERPELAALLAEVGHPAAQYSAIVQQFFVFGLMFTLAQTMLAPFVQVVTDDIWTNHPDRPLSPPDAATMAVRGIEPGGEVTTAAPEWAMTEALKSGLSNDRFQALVDATGMPPNLTMLFEMIRKGIITEDELTKGIKQGDTRDEWIPSVSKLRYVEPSPTDFVRAAVQSQMTYDQANALAIAVGLMPAGYLNDNPDYFRLLYDTAGRPPGPEEMGRAALRGITDWDSTGPTSVSFAQAISESDIKDKYIPILKALTAYIPPPRMVGGLLKSGSITADQAKTFWMMSGVSSSLADAYVHQALTEQVEQERALGMGKVLTAYYDRIIDATQATAMLGNLGYVGQVATYLLEIQDDKRIISLIDAEAKRIGSYYAHYKMTETDAKTALSTLGIPDPQITEMMEVWSVERQAPVRLPTAEQIAKAVKYSTLSIPDALSKLEVLGYTAYDAAIVLSAGAETEVTPLPPNDDTGVRV